jgi:hydrogenase-4 component F
MITSLYLIFLTVIFIGIIGIAIQMTQGRADDVTNRHTSGHFWAVIPPLFLIIIVFLLGLYIPEPVNQAVQEVARTLGGI